MHTDGLYQYHAAVERTVDGDTLDLFVDCGFGVFNFIRVRLKGVDTPEIYGVKEGSEEYKAGKEASEFVNQWVTKHGPILLIKTYHDKGGFSRWLAEVFSLDGEHQLGEDLLEAGLAEIYE